MEGYAECCAPVLVVAEDGLQECMFCSKMETALQNNYDFNNVVGIALKFSCGKLANSKH
jgi:hypothetical protein